MPTNFQLKRLKLKLDIVEKPENRVHKLTDSNGAHKSTLVQLFWLFIFSCLPQLNGAPLESVSLCTRFSGFSTISSFGFNRLS